MISSVASLGNTGLSAAISWFRVCCDPYLRLMPCDCRRARSEFLASLPSVSNALMGMVFKQTCLREECSTLNLDDKLDLNCAVKRQTAHPDCCPCMPTIFAKYLNQQV